MGIFSFLTGKKDESEGRLKPAPTTDGESRRTRSDSDATDRDAADVGSGFSRTDRDAADAGSGFSRTDRDAADAGSGFSRTETSATFTPPEAWNIDALTAPIPEPTGEKPEVGEMDAAQTAALQGKIVEALKTVYDPEIPVDIYELGLIYEIIVDAERRVLVKMTLTSPACPSAQQIPSEVRYKIKAIPDVTDAWVEIVWDPPWSKDRMSEAAKLQLGFF